MYEDRIQHRETVGVSLKSSYGILPRSVSARRGHDATNDALAIPEYLRKNYWWAYLWPPAVWFFDHQLIINSIVFGQYRKLVGHLVQMLNPQACGDTLMIASAYGNVIPRVAAAIDPRPLTVIDIAPIQLERARAKLDKLGIGNNVTLKRMNAESLDFVSDRFDTSFMFLLLHELPPDARRRALREALRVTRSGGHLVLAEYGEGGTRHIFHRWSLFRWIFGKAEPFLPSLWETDLDALLEECATALGKRVVSTDKTWLFHGFYRVWRWRIEQL